MEARIKLNPKFKSLYTDDSRYFILTGGRGSSKSYHVADWASKLTYEKDHKILFTRWTMVSAHLSVIPEFTSKLEAYNVLDNFDITKVDIENKSTQSKILFRGIKTSQGIATANLKSIEGLTTLIGDEMEELVLEEVFDRIDLSIRSKKQSNRVVLIMNPSNREHWVYKRFFGSRGVPEGFSGKIGDTPYIHTTYLDNMANLSQSFLDQAERTKEVNMLRYNHIYLGHWLDSSEGLLWDMAILDKFRVQDAPQIVRVVVAIDPAITAKAGSDETGIIVVGVGVDNKGYVLEDGSGTYSPNEWAAKVSQLYHKWQANEVVAEVNQGGDMVESTIKTVDASIYVHKVHATKGKFVRAEPIYALYQQGKVHHVGYHSKLESQLVTWNPSDEHTSPDRMDALVWGLTRLMLVSQPTSKGSTRGRMHRPKSI